MSLYIAPITKLRKQEITSSEINYKFHEPYCWFHYFISEAIKSNSKYILFQEEQEREFGGMNSDYWTDYFIELNKRLIVKIFLTYKILKNKIEFYLFKL